MDEKVILFGFIFLSTVFAFCAILASCLTRVKTPLSDKGETYECAMQPIGDARINFDIKFLLYAILFLIFDVETILIFPFAVAFSMLESFALVEIIIFILILLFGLFYAIKKGLLKWQ